MEEVALDNIRTFSIHMGTLAIKVHVVGKYVLISKSTLKMYLYMTWKDIRKNFKIWGKKPLMTNILTSAQADGVIKKTK